MKKTRKNCVFFEGKNQRIGGKKRKEKKKKKVKREKKRHPHPQITQYL
jgi:hypothetical protein